MDTFLIATRNTHKVEEIAALLSPSLNCLGLQGFSGVPEIVEDATTFEGNAAKKAFGLVRWLGGEGKGQCPLVGGARLWVLADDSGLEVDALGGAPGVHSARFAALDDLTRRGNSPDAENNSKLLSLLQDVPEASRGARFRCVLVLVEVSEGSGQAEPFVFQGACEGRIARQPSGVGGFGYDPLFIPTGETASFAELGAVVKNRMSHRARALQELLSFRSTR